MRLAIPSNTADGLEAIRSGHFGHAPFITIVSFDENMDVAAVEVHPNADHDAAGCLGVVDHVLGMDVNAILTAGMGRRPYMAFEGEGIAVYLETASPKVADAVQAFAVGNVYRMTPQTACSHHHHH